MPLKPYFAIPAWLVTFAFLLSFDTSAGNFENGVREAAAKNWTAANASFQQYVTDNPYDAAGYYNLGTGLASLRHYEKAVWAFEKCLKLDPGFAEAVQNIHYCYVQLGISEPWEPALTFFQEKTYQFGIDAWTYLSIATALGMAVLLFFFIAVQRTHIRKVLFLFLLLGLVLLVFNIYNASSAYRFRYSATHGILMQDQQTVYPANTGNKRIDLSLQKGTRYELTEISEGRAGLRMQNGSVIWVDQQQVRAI
jgi:tetratricopeptide (TPR) repeat protein